MDELELLVALVEAPLRWWDPVVVSKDLGTTAARARTMLDRFAAANLLDIRVTDDVRYQFRPGTTELHEGACALASAYRARPAAIIQRLTDAAPRSVRDFADAFRIRRHGRS